MRWPWARRDPDWKAWADRQWERWALGDKVYFDGPEGSRVCPFCFYLHYTKRGVDLSYTHVSRRERERWSRRAAEAGCKTAALSRCRCGRDT